jgi:CheY-like chemotaxis protein
MEGYAVRSADTGEAALQILNTSVPDLIMLDLSMPRISGWEVLHFIRQHPDLHRIPVVVLTANADDDTRRRTAHERVDALLVKPVSLDEVLEILNELLA